MGAWAFAVGSPTLTACFPWTVCVGLLRMRRVLHNEGVTNCAVIVQYRSPQPTNVDCRRQRSCFSAKQPFKSACFCWYLCDPCALSLPFAARALVQMPKFALFGDTMVRWQWHVV